VPAGGSGCVPHSRQRQWRRVRRGHGVGGRVRQSGAAIGGHGCSQPGLAAPVSVVLAVMMMVVVVVMMTMVVVTVVVVVVVVMIAVIVLVVQTAAAVLRVAGVPAPAPVVSVIRRR